MQRLRLVTPTVWAPALIAVLLMTLPVLAGPDEASDQLHQAIALFDAGDYLAAQDVITGIDREELSEQERTLRDDYLNRIQVALIMTQTALDYLDDAEVAIEEGDHDQARTLLEAVLANEYAPTAVLDAARAMLRDLQPAAEPAPAVTAEPTPAPIAGVAPEDAERARVLCGEAAEMVKGGRYDEATRLYQQALELVPGHPDATAGLKRIAEHEQNILGARSGSLIDEIRRADAIAWQRSLTEYRSLEQRIQEEVAGDQYDLAHKLVLSARQVVESARQFADPVTKYEQLRAEVDALANYVRDQEREYNERRVGEIRRRVEQDRRRNLKRFEENKRRQIDSLMKQARQHYKDGDLQAGINVLKQVQVIDPQYHEARWLMDSWDDQLLYEQGAEYRDQLYKQTRRSFLEVEEAKVPWWERVRYPKDWLEIISRPQRNRPGEAPKDALLLSRLDAPVPVDFRADPLQQVIEHFADAHDLNVIVNWTDLRNAGVQPNAPISLQLPQEITLKRALEEVLDQAGGGVVDLGYEVRDGVLSIATQQHLDQRTYTAVYDIHDLLMETPNYNDAPTMAVGREHERHQQRALYGDRPWLFGDDDDDEGDRDPGATRRVRELIELISTAVAPDSWRDAGGSVGSIMEFNGQLVITQNSAGHSQISGLLDKLREQQAIQVAVEARFLTVSSNYLEELGLDLDIYLNQGNAGFDFLQTGIPESPIQTDPVTGGNLLLPRQFSRLGYGPTDPASTGAVGTTFSGPGGQTVVNVTQPYNNPVLIPLGGTNEGNNMTPVPISTNILDFTDPSNLSSDVPGSFAGQAIKPALSIFGSFLDNIQVDFLIRATQADSRTTVLTAPHLVLSNGQTAWVAVQTQTFFVSQLIPQVNVGAAAQAPQTSSVPTGAVLTVQATVSADRRYVKMNLTPGISRLLSLNTFTTNIGGTAGTGFVQIPELATTTVQTTVTIPDGGTLLIGGQKLASEIEIDAGVPVLSKIPILKRAYSSRALAKDEQTLLILVKPQVLIQSEQEEMAFPSFSEAD